MMELAIIADSLAIALYAVAGVFLFLQVKQGATKSSSMFIAAGGAGLIAHAVGAYGTIVAEQGFRFGFFVVPTVFFWVINLLVLVRGLSKPLHNLFIFLFPLSAIAILSSAYGHSSITTVEPALAAHIILSLIAYSLLTIATLEALLLAYLNRQLKNKHATGLVKVLPPLQTLDELMFELIWTGQIVLTLAIITGIIFVGNFFSQLSSHHAMISIIAWLIYATLLWGHHKWGWRGKIAVRWALGGFTALVLAYFGTKFVSEIILDRPTNVGNAKVFYQSESITKIHSNYSPL